MRVLGELSTIPERMVVKADSRASAIEIERLTSAIEIHRPRYERRMRGERMKQGGEA